MERKESRDIYIYDDGPDTRHWKDINAILSDRAPRVRSWNSYIYKFVGYAHVLTKLGILVWTWKTLLLDVIFARMVASVALVHFSFTMFLMICILVNWYKCMTLDNTIPDCWVPPNAVYDGGRCVFCKRVRPIRAHHCEPCGCCQLKRDHHCYWINNCVGYFNYRYFVALCLCDSLLAAHTVVLTYEYASMAFILQEAEHPFSFITLFSIGLIACPILAFYFIMHVILILRARTAPEFMKGFDKLQKNPFDLGCLRNWMLVWGNHPFAIFFPLLAPDPSPDLLFPMNAHAKKHLLRQRDSEDDDDDDDAYYDYYNHNTSTDEDDNEDENDEKEEEGGASGKKNGQGNDGNRETNAERRREEKKKKKRKKKKKKKKKNRHRYKIRIYQSDEEEEGNHHYIQSEAELLRWSQMQIEKDREKEMEKEKEKEREMGLYRMYNAGSISTGSTMHTLADNRISNNLFAPGNGNSSEYEMGMGIGLRPDSNMEKGSGDEGSENVDIHIQLIREIEKAHKKQLAKEQRDEESVYLRKQQHWRDMGYKNPASISSANLGGSGGGRIVANGSMALAGSLSVDQNRNHSQDDSSGSNSNDTNDSSSSTSNRNKKTANGNVTEHIMSKISEVLHSLSPSPSPSPSPSSSSSPTSSSSSPLSSSTAAASSCSPVEIDTEYIDYTRQKSDGAIDGADAGADADNDVDTGAGVDVHAGADTGVDADVDVDTGADADADADAGEVFCPLDDAEHTTAAADHVVVCVDGAGADNEHEDNITTRSGGSGSPERVDDSESKESARVPFQSNLGLMMQAYERQVVKGMQNRGETMPVPSYTK